MEQHAVVKFLIYQHVLLHINVKIISCLFVRQENVFAQLNTIG